MLVHILLQNTKANIQEALNTDYIRILKMNDQGQRYLNTIKKKAQKKLVTNLKQHHHPALDLEIKATRLLSLLDQNIYSNELKNIPICKKDQD